MTIQDTTEPFINPSNGSNGNDKCIPESRRFARTILSRYSDYLNISLSSPHWQLKDLLKSTSYSSKFDDYNYNDDPVLYIPYKDRVFYFKFNDIRASDNKHVHTDLINYASIKFQSSPRCLDQLDDIIVAGGIQSGNFNRNDGSNSNNNNNGSNNSIGLQRGFFSFYNNQNGITENIQVGDFINNCVTINKISNNHYHSYLCNNDKNLYQYDLTPSKIIQSTNAMYLKVALNHTISSHDNKTLITLGDSSKIFISHPQEKPINFDILKTEGDCGFSTSLLSNGYQFVSCFQDGLALIYDLRNLNNPIHVINSTRPKTQSGAFRVVKTSSLNDDLICISEHQGRIHLIDARNFNNHSVLLLPKYLYNVPPSITVNHSKSKFLGYRNNINSTQFKSLVKMFGSYPIATDSIISNSSDADDDAFEDSMDNYSYSTEVSVDSSNKDKVWYNQPIVKNIEDFDDLKYFGKELSLGYLESHRYNFTNNNYLNGFNRGYSFNNNVGLDTGNDYRNNDAERLRVILQGSFDREDLLRRKTKMEVNPRDTRIFTYTDYDNMVPTKIRKINGGRNEEIKNVIDDCWWNKYNLNDEYDDFKKYWPWGRNVKPTDGDFNIMETPERDPFFYIDSDIEINGLELARNKGKTTLCIGTKEGILLWDINEWKRKCFPNFEYT